MTESYTIIATSFDTFWASCPRKADKKKAEKAFDKLSDVNKFNCIQGMAHHAANNPQWKDPSFIPLPTTFINGERWNDTIAIPQDAKARAIGFNNGDAVHDVVWSAMTQMFGDAWIKKHGETAPELWRKLLKDISKERILRAFKRCLDDHKDFPPSLPKFMEYTAKTFGEEHRTALPKPKGDPVLASNSLRQMMEILGVKQ